MKNTKKMSFAAIAAALSVIILYLGAVAPSGKLAATAIAGLITAAVLIECGWTASVLSFAVSGMLGLLLLPQRFPAIVYLAFFGYYPIVKCLAERVKSRAVEWIIKLCVFNAAIAAAYTLFRLAAFAIPAFPAMPIYVIWAAANIVFVIYDFGFSALLSFYMRSIHAKIK